MNTTHLSFDPTGKINIHEYLVSRIYANECLPLLSCQPMNVNGCENDVYVCGNDIRSANAWVFNTEKWNDIVHLFTLFIIISQITAKQQPIWIIWLVSLTQQKTQNSNSFWLYQFEFTHQVIDRCIWMFAYLILFCLRVVNVFWLFRSYM